MPKKSPSPRRLLNAKAAGIYLGRSSRSIRRMAYRKELPYRKGKDLLDPYWFEINDLDAWVDQQEKTA